MTTHTITQAGKSYRIIDPGGRVGSKVSHGEPYERKLLTDIRQRRLTGTAFDIGAHVGNHSLYLAAVCGFTVHAWECHAPTVERLRANLALNRGIDVTVHEWAAGREAGTGRLTDGRWVEFDPARHDRGVLVDGGEIRVAPIDEMLNVNDLAVVKVDVEGTEADVLAGMIRHLARCTPLVYAETHTIEAHQATADVMEPLGYEMTRAIHMGSTMERWEVTS